MSLVSSFKGLNLSSRYKSIGSTIRCASSGRSKRGLFDGKDVRSGNNVPFSHKKTKRTFKPNVFKKRLYSEILDEMIQFHATSSALRTIDKMGGLDNYLLSGKVTQGEGWDVKQKILQRIETCERTGIDVFDQIVLKSEEATSKEILETA